MIISLYIGKFVVLLFFFLLLLSFAHCIQPYSAGCHLGHLVLWIKTCGEWETDIDQSCHLRSKWLFSMNFIKRSHYKMQTLTINIFPFIYNIYTSPLAIVLMLLFFLYFFVFSIGLIAEWKSELGSLVNRSSVSNVCNCLSGAAQQTVKSIKSLTFPNA